MSNERPEPRIFDAKISDLSPTEKNPRKISKEKLAVLEKRMKKYPKFIEAREVVVDEDLRILGGHQRVKVTKARGDKTIRVKQVFGWSEDEKDNFIIADNVADGEWDEDILGSEWDEDKIAEWLDEEKESFDELDDKYSTNLGDVFYEPSDEKHEVAELYTPTDRFDEVIEEVKNSEIREMLSIRKAWFCKFDFAKIADYYANQATDEEKTAFEKMGLVLLDRDGLLDNGFAEISEELL